MNLRKPFIKAALSGQFRGPYCNPLLYHCHRFPLWVIAASFLRPRRLGLLAAFGLAPLKLALNGLPDKGAPIFFLIML
jgi:hypothetical protein